MDRKRRTGAAKSQATPQGLPKIRPDWIKSFLDFTEDTTSPKLFRKWGAICTIAGALERKVWVRSLGSAVYPNMYVILVAPPGVGKTEVTWRVRTMWEKLEDHFIAATSVTKASLIDELAEANRRYITNNSTNPVEHFNSLLLCINELGVLIPGYENEFMNTLTDLWDCKHYSERRRTSKIEIDIDRPQLNLLAACTPSYLMHVLPEGAWDQGFISRTMLIYSGDRQLRSLFQETAQMDDEWEGLHEHLAHISNLYGEMKFTAGAAAMMDKFHLTEGAITAPEHPKLISYSIRRTVHLIKLCMVVSASRSDELIIREEDFQVALDYMIEAERQMPEIFKAASSGGAGKTMEEAWYYIFTIHSKEQKPILKHRLIQFLKERVPVHNIETTIKMMEQGNMIEKRLTAAGEAYVPRGKAAAL